MFFDPQNAGCRVMGVEITGDAQPIQAHPFNGPTAFMLGNEVRPSELYVFSTEQTWCETHESAGL